MKKLWRRLPAGLRILPLFLALVAAVHLAYGVPWARGAVLFLGRKIFLPVLSFLPGLVPFSCFEILVAAAAAGLLVYILLLILGLWRAEKKGEFLCRRLSFLACVIAGGYLLFCVVWGASYYEPPLGEELGLRAAPVSSEELYKAGVRLVAGLNEASRGAPRDTGKKFLLPGGKDEIRRAAPAIMENSGYAFLEGHFPPPKALLSSELFNYLFIDGIYSPFTGEANVNGAGHPLFFPSAVLHEMAHQRGIAREDEANFVAFLVGSESADPAFSYAAYCLAYNHLSRALLSADPDKAAGLAALVDPLVWQDFRDYNAFLDRYVTKAKDVSEATNDAYLKSQGQAEGVRSYGRMVDLLVALLLTES